MIKTHFNLRKLIILLGIILATILSLILNTDLLANSARDPDFIYDGKSLYIPVPQEYKNLTYTGFLITRYEPIAVDSNVNEEYKNVVEIDGKKQWFVPYSKNGTTSSTNTEFINGNGFSSGTQYFKLDYSKYDRQLFSYYAEVKNNKYQQPIYFKFLENNTKFKLVVNHIYRNQAGEDITVQGSTKEYFYQLSKPPILTQDNSFDDTQIISHIVSSDIFVNPFDTSKQKDMTKFYTKFTIASDNPFDEKFTISYNIYDYRDFNKNTGKLHDNAIVLKTGTIESNIQKHQLPYEQKIQLPLDTLDDNRNYCLEIKVSNDKFSSSSLFHEIYTDYQKPTARLNVIGDDIDVNNNIMFNANDRNKSTINATLNLNDNNSLKSLNYEILTDSRTMNLSNSDYNFKTGQSQSTINITAPFDKEGKIELKINSLYDYGSNNQKNILADGDKIFYDSLAPRIKTRRQDGSLVNSAPAITLQNLLQSKDRYLLEFVIEDYVAGVDLNKTGPKTNLPKSQVTEKPDGSQVGLFYKVDEYNSEYDSTVPTTVTYWLVGNINNMEYTVVDFTAIDNTGNSKSVTLTAEVAIKPTSVYVSESSLLLVESETSTMLTKAIPYSMTNGELIVTFDDPIYAKLTEQKEVQDNYTQLTLKGLYRGTTVMTISSKANPAVRYRVPITVVPHSQANLTFNSQLSYFSSEVDNYNNRLTTVNMPKVEPTKLYFNIRSWVDKELDVEIKADNKTIFHDKLVAPNMIDEIVTLDYPKSSYNALELEVIMNGKHTKTEKYYVTFGTLPYDVTQSGSDITVVKQKISIPNKYPQPEFTKDILAGFVESEEDLYEFRTYSNDNDTYVKTPIGYMNIETQNLIQSIGDIQLKQKAKTVILPNTLQTSSKPYLALQGKGTEEGSIVTYKRDTVHSTNGVKVLNITEGNAFTPKVNITLGLENIILDKLTSADDWDKFEQGIQEAVFIITPDDGTEQQYVFKDRNSYPKDILNSSGIYTVTFKATFKETGETKEDTITMNFLRENDKQLVDVDNTVKYSFNRNIIANNTTRNSFIAHNIKSADQTTLGIKGTYLKGLIILYSNESTTNSMEIYNEDLQLINSMSGNNVNSIELFEDTIYVGTDLGLFSLNEDDGTLNPIRSDRVTAMYSGGRNLLIAYGNTIESFKDSSNKVTVNKVVTEMYLNKNNTLIIIGEDKYITSLYS